MSDDLFTYDVKLQEVSLPLIGDEQCDDLKYDHDRYIQRISYEEYEKIYVEVVILINKKLVRLIDVTMEQWLDLKYGDHMTMDENIKKGVIATWLIRSYKWQFEDYLEIKKDRDTYAREIDMEYNPSNVVFAEWLALKLHTTWRWIDLEDTNENDDEITEIFRIETDLFNFETPLCEAFNEFNYLLKIETDLLTNDIPGFKTYDEFKDEWMDWRNEETPWVTEKPWSEDGIPVDDIHHICEPFRFKNGKGKWPTCRSNEEGFSNGGELPRMIRVGYMTYFQDYEWYDNLMDGKLKEEALKQKNPSMKNHEAMQLKG
ncbi:hypothetical protein Tco_0385463 [Tanacetum coccineum]